MSNDYTKSIDAIRGLRDGADRWTLADALLADIGPYDDRSKFDRVRDEAEAAGVDPLSVSALRQYRDTAHHWPPSTRIPGVSFSAHRAALPAKDPAGLLGDLANTYGPNGVTVKRVNESVAVLSGSTPTTAPASAPVHIAELSEADLAHELTRRGPANVAKAIRANADGAWVDSIRDGLAAIVADLDSAAAKRAAKSAAWSANPAPAPAPASAPTKPTKPTGPRPGDIRGL